MSWATSAAYKHIKAHRLEEQARRRARGIILEDIKEKDYLIARKTFAEKLIAREHDFNTMQDGLVADYGSRATNWVKLWDEGSECHFYYHEKTKEQTKGLVAICERCDQRLLPEDLKCSCGNPRSAKNQKLFKALDLGWT